MSMRCSVSGSDGAVEKADSVGSRRKCGALPSPLLKQDVGLLGGGQDYTKRQHRGSPQSLVQIAVIGDRFDSTLPSLRGFKSS